MSVEEQKMSKDKYPSIFFFVPNGGCYVYYTSNSFRNTRGFEKWGTSFRYLKTGSLDNAIREFSLA